MSENLWKDNTLNAISNCRENAHDQRFGQMIYNAIASTDDVRSVADYDSSFHSRLYFIEDDELAQAIKSWLSWLDENIPPRKIVDNS